MAAKSQSQGVTDTLGTGRRKCSVARVRLRPGTGTILINKRILEDFFHGDQHRGDVVAPLEQTGRRDSLDVIIRVHGGGVTGQSGACRLGIARALVKLDEESHQGLREGGHLTRDSRMKERKKYGLHKARKGTQFSKR